MPQHRTPEDDLCPLEEFEPMDQELAELIDAQDPEQDWDEDYEWISR